ncbi:MAG: PEP-CTERM sorting domain-containing protein [Burkholderiales bacterium]|nr:PEP-CTERM sorting domain-containing protein [Burkholderiales bacterium]
MLGQAKASVRPWLRAAVLGAMLLGAKVCWAGPIALDTFLQFSFDPSGTVAGCAPDDPGGGFCIGSSGTPTGFLDAPAWTFNAPASGATLTVVDAFLSGDEFQVFDFGVLVGATSAAAANVDCGDDPALCLATPGMSSGVFQLGAGAHALTLTALPGSLGSAYLHIAAANAVPEPASLALVLGALVGAAAYSRRTVAAQGRRT